MTMVKLSETAMLLVESIIKPKQPTGKGWERATWWQMPPLMASLGYPVEAWLHPGARVFVLSAVEAVSGDDEDTGPQYHISVSIVGPDGSPQRIDSNAAKWVLKDFGLEDATEDNHVPHGKVRNFWRPVADRFSGYECPCVESEPAITEDKGDYIWRGAPKK